MSHEGLAAPEILLREVELGHRLFQLRRRRLAFLRARTRHQPVELALTHGDLRLGSAAFGLQILVIDLGNDVAGGDLLPFGRHGAFSVPVTEAAMLRSSVSGSTMPGATTSVRRQGRRRAAVRQRLVMPVAEARAES